MTDASFHLDLTRFPLVVLTLEGALSDEQHARLLEEIDEMAERGQPYVMITDLTHAVASTPSQRQRASEWTARFEREHPHLGRGSIMIVPSGIIRASLIALNWVASKRKKDIWVASMQEAEARALSILEREGLMLPEQFRARAAGERP